MKRTQLFALISAKVRWSAYLVLMLLLSSCFSHSIQDATTIESENSPRSLSADLPPLETLRERWQQGFVFVTRVIDGDTFWVDNGEEAFKIRFIGIDAPELRNSRHKKKGPFAKEAKAYVQERTEGQWVRLEMDVQKTDRYGRMLAYIYLEDNAFLNADLVREGYAVLATFPPNVKHVELFRQLQTEAREHKRGLWKN